jgi:hypothetical protein
MLLPMAEATARDGFRLWFESIGDGPALIIPSRTRAEYRDLAVALSETYRVVRYTPRQVTGLEESMRPNRERADSVPVWASSAFDRFPVDMEIADLHSVADAAAVGDFVLAGYSGMGALAAFLAPCSDRIIGLLVGGFPPLGPWDYWLGVADGARLGYLDAGIQAYAEHAYANSLMFREWMRRDDAAALARLGGPKIVWYGGEDGEPGCTLHDILVGATMARRIRAATPDLRELGFQVIEIPGLDHYAGLYDKDAVASALVKALAETLPASRSPAVAVSRVAVARRRESVSRAGIRGNI